jgi:membrane protein implicated in regulation of membrane protease activity
MTYVFMICAVAGGTVLLCQLALTLLGVGSDWSGESFHDGPPDLGGDLGSDGHFNGGHGDVSDLSSNGHHAAWFVNVLSFRSLVAALTFFGLAGLAADAAEMRPTAQWIIALAMGAGAMYGVAWTLRAVQRLNADGTVRIQRAIGEIATVYVPIASNGQQAGKVQLNLQGRLVEYEAVTSGGHRLATGAKVRVIGLVGNRLEVEPLLERESVAS